MTSKDKCDLLAGEIKKILANGLALSREVVHYIDSTFSHPSIAELQTVLQDDSNCERDSLIELLFFPDEFIQAQLEELLENHSYQKHDGVNVSSRLCAPPLLIALHFPDTRGMLNLAVPTAACAQFVSRLNIAAHPDRRLIAAINTHLTEKLRPIAKVKIRNSRFAPAENKIDFLCQLVENLASENRDFLLCLSFALGFLEEFSDNTNIFQTMMTQKKFYLKNLKKTEQFEAQFQSSNMETLLMQGKRASYFDKAAAREKMLLIDKISRAVFGKTQFFDLAPVDQEFLELHSADDIQGIIRLLS